MREVIINLRNELLISTYNSLHYHIVQVGCGGNGGYLVQQLAQMFSLTEQKGDYLIADPDLVEKKNLRNQLFIESDVGKSKAQVLARRYRSAYKMPISFYDKQYIESKETLSFLFDENESSHSSEFGVIHFPILIGAVDNTYSRKLFHEFFYEQKNILYMDAGVTSAEIPSGKTLDNLNNWTLEEKRTFASTGFNGQVVVGLRLNGETILEPAGEVYPDILNTEEDDKPSEAACSNLVVSDPQRLMTNRMAAMAMSVYFNDLFSNGLLRNHHTVFHSQKGYMRSQPITIEE
ncbi:ThiF family adenylyltransferase [Pseudobacillus badius]|uniref:ThiF family adenylyltransferase n=1 Tax=Bacillus badius TaxID=1455 RepID=UPI003D3553EA